MSAPLRVLILEDRPSDAKLMVHELHKVGLDPEWVQVETEQDYLAHLDRSLDIILADYHLPQFDAPRALQLLQERGLNIPFIVVTGVLGDEPAVELMKLGAADYLLKDRLGRLGQAVVKALEQKQLRRKGKQAEEQAQKQMQRLTILSEITKAINSTLDLRTILNVLLEKIDLLLPYSVTTLRLLNKETGLLEAVAARNVDEEEWKTTMREGGRGFSKSALKNKTPVIIANVQKNTNAKYPEFLRKYGLISYLGVPLIAKDIILGTLGFYTKEEHEFSKEEVEFLSTLAGQAAIAIHNSHMFQQVEKRTRELTALQALTAAASESLHLNTVLQEVVKKVTEIFHFDATRIFLFDPRANELNLRASLETNPKFFAGMRAFRRGQGLVGRVADTGEALIFEDVLSDPRYQELSQSKLSRKGKFSFFAGIPIRVKNRPIGVLVCIGKDARLLTPDELRLVTSMANQIAIAVQNASLFEQTKNQAAELQRSNMVKDQFLSIMSHELRTPLHAIMGHTGMVCDKILGEINEKQERSLMMAMASSQKLLGMIYSILQVTQIEAEGVQMERQEVSLGGFLDDLRSNYEVPLDKELTLNWNYPSDLPVVKTDSEKLKIILQNLINNAIKFTDKGNVTISARYLPETKTVKFKVADMGIGISEEALPTIFEMFRQVDGSETRPYGGVGLGLYIVKKYTELLGGRIDVESERGMGSTFTVTLP